MTTHITKTWVDGDKVVTQEIPESEVYKQEPVAWMNRHGACKTSLFMEVEAGAKDEYTIPLYTTPPHPLTDQEVRRLADMHLFYQPEGYEVSGVFNLARAIEAAHGIGEKT
jgi:hypothetical protein